MKAKVQRDKRMENDKIFDDLWNKLCREARLNPMQISLVSKYLRRIVEMRIHEVESAVDMGWLIALIESEKFGTDVTRGAKRLIRCQQYSADVRNEAYGHSFIDANGVFQDYDNCGCAHLQVRLKRHGVDYDVKI